MKVRTRRPRRSGFTLMEVLLVLAILVILGSFVTVGYVRLQQNANRDAATSQIKLIESAVELYTLDVGAMPSATDGLQALRTQPSDLGNPAKWRGPYLNQEIPKDPWGGDYQYEQTQDNDGNPIARIWSNGPDGAPGGNDDIDPTTDMLQGVQ
jgi:general secretion pathway protein G